MTKDQGLRTNDYSSFSFSFSSTRSDPQALNSGRQAAPRFFITFLQVLGPDDGVFSARP